MTAHELPDAAYLQPLIDEALREDGAADDRTVSFLRLGGRPIAAVLRARAAGILAGVDVARMVFERTDPEVRFDGRIRDGERVGVGDVIAEMRGRADRVLSAERVALNFLQRLSGVATLTGRFVEAVRGTGIRIVDTRKTTPLLRRLERYAVAVGGGLNHRFNLGDGVLVKENHIRSLGGEEALVGLLSSVEPRSRIEVEVDSIDFLRKLLGSPVDQIMLDNFSPAEIRLALKEIGAYRRDHPGFKPAIEVSGGIRLDNVAAYAIEGVDYISVGALTHSAPALDISLETA